MQIGTQDIKIISVYFLQIKIHFQFIAVYRDWAIYCESDTWQVMQLNDNNKNQPFILSLYSLSIILTDVIGKITGMILWPWKS